MAHSAIRQDPLALVRCWGLSGRTSVPHPGGNLTAVVVDPGLEIWGKRLELLQEIVPGLSKVGFLATRLNWELPQGQGVAIRQAAQRLRLTISGSALDESGREADYRRAFAGMSHDRVGALVVSDEPENFTNRKVIVELAESAGLPAIYPWRENIELMPSTKWISFATPPTKSIRSLRVQILGTYRSTNQANSSWSSI